MEALYYKGLVYSGCFFIPKRKGIGFLKSPLGGHHANEFYHEFMDTDIDGVKYNEVFDVDGYLSIGLPYETTERECATEELTICLSEIFTHISEWREISKKEWWDIIN